MFVPRPTSPLALEPPLSSISPEYADDNSDSESDLDENARAAKRRRIEQLGQDYLQGKPLLIFTASLKGPFDNGWVNPWKRTSSRTKKRLPGATNGAQISRPPAIPESITRPSSRKPPSATPKSPHVPPSREARHVSESETGSKRRTGKKRRTSTGEARSSPRQQNSTGCPTNANQKPIRFDQIPERSRPKRNRKSDPGWLRKDGEGMHHEVLHLPKSPSPTPNHRPNSRQKSGTEGMQNRDEGRNYQNSHEIESRMGGFTPINGRKSRSGVSPSHAGHRSASISAESPAIVAQPRDLPSSRQAASSKLPSGFREPLAPASAKSTHERNSSSKTSRPVSTRVQSDANSRQSLHVVSPADHPAEFRVYRRDSQHLAQNRAVKPPSRPNAHDTQTSFTQVSVDRDTSTRSSKEGPAMKGTTSKEHSNPNSKEPSGNGSHNIHSTRTESDGITSAQIVPGKTKFPDVVMSLASTEWAGSAKPASEVREVLDGTGEGFSTQAAIAVAEKSLQDDLASPEKAPPVLLDGDSARAQITPFHLFHAPGRTTAHSDTNVAGGEPNNTQAVIDAVSPDDFSTVKKVQFGASKASSDKEIVVNSGSPTDYRGKPGPARATATSTGNPGQELLARKTSGLSDNHQVQQPPVPTPEDSSVRSSGTVLPFTLSASTNGTKQQQDGQAVADLDSFDLSQAIADAGSFLQSWDINRDLSSHSQKNAASPGRALHSMTSVNGAKGG